MPVPYQEEEEEEDAEAEASSPEADVQPADPFVKGCCGCCSSSDEEVQPPRPSVVVQQPTLDEGFYWCVATGEIPPNAIKAGVDKDGGDIYVGRAIHNGEIIPAKIIANHNCAYVPWGGEEHRKDEYEVLCKGNCTVIWQECQGGMVPENAVSVGVTSENERLYIGRVFNDGTHTPGKIHPSHGVCYIAYDGAELSFPQYEVLILL